jgi:hypothetical protein
MFVRGQQYSIVLNLDLPESNINKDLGNHDQDSPHLMILKWNDFRDIFFKVSLTHIKEDMVFFCF